MKYGVLGIMNIKIRVFWDVTTCRMVCRYLHFGETCALHFQGSESSRLRHGKGQDHINHQRKDSLYVMRRIHMHHYLNGNEGHIKVVHT
jgi:hypothetical protein